MDRNLQIPIIVLMPGALCFDDKDQNRPYIVIQNNFVNFHYLFGSETTSSHAYTHFIFYVKFLLMDTNI